jgi:ribonuclease HI
MERHEINWHWVRGHAGNPSNERADELATKAREALRRQGSLRPSQRETNASADPKSSHPEEQSTADADLPKVDIYTRGCALGVPGPGGYAAVITHDDSERVVSGSWPLTTNNVMELWGVVAALRALKQPSHVTIHTSSKYVQQGATKWLAGWERRGWRTRAGRPVKNREIWTELSHVMGDHDICWEHEPTGDGGKESDQAYAIARQEAEAERAQGNTSDVRKERI